MKQSGNIDAVSEDMKFSYHDDYDHHSNKPNFNSDHSIQSFSLQSVNSKEENELIKKLKDTKDQAEIEKSSMTAAHQVYLYYFTVCIYFSYLKLF